MASLPIGMVAVTYAVGGIITVSSKIKTIYNEKTGDMIVRTEDGKIVRSNFSSHSSPAPTLPPR